MNHSLNQLNKNPELIQEWNNNSQWIIQSNDL